MVVLGSARSWGASTTDSMGSVSCEIGLFLVESFVVGLTCSCSTSGLLSSEGVASPVCELPAVGKEKEADGHSVSVFKGLLVLRNPSWNGKCSSLNTTCLEVKILP